MSGVDQRGVRDVGSHVRTKRIHLFRKRGLIWKPVYWVRAPNYALCAFYRPRQISIPSKHPAQAEARLCAVTCSVTRRLIPSLQLNTVEENNSTRSAVWLLPHEQIWDHFKLSTKVVQRSYLRRSWLQTHLPRSTREHELALERAVRIPPAR